jgi:hypothetical protein
MTYNGIRLRDVEAKRWSQHGEDGIIATLCAYLKAPRNYCFVEVGAHPHECNSRALLADGWSGRVFDASRDNMKQYQQELAPAFAHTPVPWTLKAESMEGFWDMICGDDLIAPDFFSLDIDSFDYFVADWLLRKGFRPKVVCVETNTFIPGLQSVPYQFPYSRYALQPGIGLYFGCSIGAWQDLWGCYGYDYCGMESSNTNAFFVRRDAVDGLDIKLQDAGYQTYFCSKYRKSGEELRATLDGMTLLDVQSEAYEKAFDEFSHNVH